MTTVYFYAFISVIGISLISLIGVSTLSLRTERLRGILFLFVALAVGALLGDAFFHLLPEAFEKTDNAPQVSFLVLLGLLLFFWFEKLLHWHHGHHGDISEIEHEDGGVQPLGKLILLSDGLHNFLDGLIIGASYLISIEVGIATSIAVVLHEIPQEIGDFGVLLHAGYSKGKAIFYNFISALTAIAGVLMIMVMGSSSERMIGFLIPFAAGTFIYIATADLVPELHKQRWSSTVLEFIAILLGVGAMYGLLFLE